MAIKESTAVSEVSSAEAGDHSVHGEFVNHAGERYYIIRDVDQMPAFFMSIISSSDHWMYISSTGGLSAGKRSAEYSLFPYNVVDRIHESTPHTGPKTVIRHTAGDKVSLWEPFMPDHQGLYTVHQNLYKNVLGNRVMFEQINQDLGIVFRYTWAFSDEFGFVRECELINTGNRSAGIELVDGLQNIMPANVGEELQSRVSNLVDAYKWTEMDQQTGLALFTVYSQITDKALPSESLRANTVFSTGLDDATVLISSTQLPAFYRGEQLRDELHKRGLRGAYLLNTGFELAAGDTRKWRIVANVGSTQADVVDLKRQLADKASLDRLLTSSMQDNSRALERIMASADGFQVCRDEATSAHHYANVMFNVLRGGIVDDQYTLSASDFRRNIDVYNHGLYRKHAELLDNLPRKIDRQELLSKVESTGDPQLMRLAMEYLPITFGRRHGDPSRPWNKFEIKLTDERGRPLLSYQGNWRDIFQNWEALALSYPEYIESFITRFVNASTVDGYNPYRITKDGIDWEVEDPEDMWSFIGYWGDHQIIYLLKFLEQSANYHGDALVNLLDKEVFSYANVPYRIKSVDEMIEDSKDTIAFDHTLHSKLEGLVDEIGADAKAILTKDGDVYLVNLMEKLLVTLLAKLSNLVVEGGIWLSTQRPEWNDANNAIVGNGLSMVTMYYMRRYIAFLDKQLEKVSGEVSLSTEVCDWTEQTAAALAEINSTIGAGSIDDAARFKDLHSIAQVATEYRSKVYAQEGFSGKGSLSYARIREMLASALAVIDHSISVNRRDDGMYQAYNLIGFDESAASVRELYPMLEGQVAALSSGSLEPEVVVTVLDSLFGSNLYRDDQKTFMLYADRQLPGFLARNRVSAELVETAPLLLKMLEDGDGHIIIRDSEGQYRFNPDIDNEVELNARLDQAKAEYGDEVDRQRDTINQIYESVYNHQAFTGRSGSMFGFEGLGCIYWHMVSKLLLATQENFFAAVDAGADAAVIKKLGDLYYRVRLGIGFNKTPDEYGAFPTDPYSHTPGYAGAKQPGMTGQVKEEVITRNGELGVRVDGGQVRFQPSLLRSDEFLGEPVTFRYMDVSGAWQEIELAAGNLGFTLCQVPVIFTLVEGGDVSLRITSAEGGETACEDGQLSAELSDSLFKRDGSINRITLEVGRECLFS